MKMNNKKKKVLGVGAALGVVAALSGTFAWITYGDQRVNRVSASQLADGSVQLVENWTPPTNWIPGTSTTKEVQVTNTGEAPVLVRISYEEALKSLVSKGNSEAVDTAYGAKSTPALTDAVPVNFNADSYKNKTEWKDITAKVKGFGENSKVKVFATGSVTYDPATSSNKVSFEYVAFNEYETGKYQKVTADVSIKEDPAVGSSVENWVYNDATNVKYYQYSGGYQYTLKNWAGNKDLLGTAGVRYGVNFDYTKEGTGVDTTSLAATPGQAPTTPNTLGNVLADTEALGSSSIKIKYASVTDSASLTGTGTLKKWIYNPEDGYFYYLSKVNSGDTTEQIMSSLNFDSEADEKYTNMTYDLIVKSEAIQAVGEALTDTSGWGMGNGETTTKILTELNAAISK